MHELKLPTKVFKKLVATLVLWSAPGSRVNM